MKKCEIKSLWINEKVFLLTYISSLTWLANNLNRLFPHHFKYHSVAVQLVNRAIHKLDRLLTSQSINSRPQVELKRTGNCCCYYYYYCFVRGVVSSSQSHHRMIMAWHKICLGSINWALLNKNDGAIDNATYTLKGTHSGLIRIVGISPSGFASNYVCVCVCVRVCQSVCVYYYLLLL